MSKKNRNRIISLVALLLLPLIMQTVHVLHVSAHNNKVVHCHHNHEGDTHNEKHDHKECLICDFEFSLFSDDLSLYSPEPHPVSYSIFLAKEVVFHSTEQFNLNPLRGPPIIPFI